MHGCYISCMYRLYGVGKRRTGGMEWENWDTYLGKSLLVYTTDKPQQPKVFVRFDTHNKLA